MIFTIGYFFRDIIGMSIFAAGFSVITSVAMIYVITGGKKSKTFLTLVFFGSIGFILGLIFIGIKPSLVAVPPIFSLLGFVYLKISNSLFKKQEKIV